MEPRIINLPKIFDPRGNLSYIEEQSNLPFIIKRIYWIYDVPGGEKRGGHAFRQTQELIVALSGSFDLILHNGNNKYHFQLNRSYYGVYVPKMVWRMIENFSTNSCALIISSTEYDQKDYIRNFDDFLKIIGK